MGKLIERDPRWVFPFNVFTLVIQQEPQVQSAEKTNPR